MDQASPVSAMEVRHFHAGFIYLIKIILGGNIFRCFPDLGQEAELASKRRRVADRNPGIYR